MGEKLFGELRGVKAIAEFLGVSDRTVERLLVTDQTEMPVSRIGGRWIADADDLRDWALRKVSHAA